MTRSAFSLFVFGVYLVTLGAAFIFIPNLLLPLFGVLATTEIFVRIVGMLLFLFGILDLLASRAGLVPFIRWSVPLRSSVILFFTLFVFVWAAPPALILFATIDLAAAMWTFVELRKEGRAA